MASTMSVGGIVSGLQTDSIIEKLQQIAMQPVTRYQAQKSILANQSQIWNQVNTRLLSLKDSAALLAGIAPKAFTATSSDPSISITADENSIAGNYNFTVESLANYHQVTTEEFDAKDTGLGVGSFKIDSAAKSITIAVNDMTLEGLRDAINAQTDVGVKAMIISTGGTTPKYRLVLTAQSLGTTGAITTDINWTSGVEPTIQTLQAVTDTVLKFGTGVNSFTIARSTKSPNDVIPGLTLNITPESVGKSINISVSRDNANIKHGLNSLISQYNAFIDLETAQDSYDDKTKTTGALFGNIQFEQLSSSLFSNLMNPLSELPVSLNQLSQIGLKRDAATGKLSLDETVFDEIFSESPDGVRLMLAITGESANGDIDYISSSEQTKSSGSAGYNINVTTLATQGRLTIGISLPDTLSSDETLTLNGTAITLTSGFTRDDVVTAINDQTSQSGITASLTGADGTGMGNYLTLTTVGYGSSARISAVESVTDGIGVGTTEINLSAPGTGNTAVAGVNVAGTINGVSATGIGQTLTSDNGDSKGLQVQITGTATGDLGNVVFTRGIGSIINQLLDSLTNDTTGSIKSTQDSITGQIDRLDQAITNATDSATREMDRIRSQFNAMEAALSRLQNQGIALSNMLASFSSSSSSSQSNSS